MRRIILIGFVLWSVMVTGAALGGTPRWAERMRAPDGAIVERGQYGHGAMAHLGKPDRIVRMPQSPYNAQIWVYRLHGRTYYLLVTSGKIERIEYEQ